MLKDLKLEKYVRNHFTLADFEIIPVKNKKKGVLGQGSFATVNLVRHKYSGQLYALKQVNIAFLMW